MRIYYVNFINLAGYVVVDHDVRNRRSIDELRTVCHLREFGDNILAAPDQEIAPFAANGNDLQWKLLLQDEVSGRANRVAIQAAA